MKNVFSGILAALVVAGNVAGADAASRVAFTEHVIAGKYYYAYGLAVADLDSDGDLDFTSSDTLGLPGTPETDPKREGKGNLYWFENDGKGVFSRHFIQKDESGYLERHAIGDVNGDGRPDIVMVKNRVGHLIWFENSGQPTDGALWRRHVITTDFMRAYDVALNDVDRDGDLDVISTGYRGNVLAWFANPGADKLGGKEWKKEVIDDQLEEARNMRLGDFNGDGILDPLATGFMGGVTAWYEQTGNATAPWKRHVIDQSSPQPAHGMGADIDGDGDADVVMAVGMRVVENRANLDAHEVIWYENTWKGERWTKHLIDKLPFAFEAVAGDLNGDGRLDVVAISYAKTAAHLVWYENPGDFKSSWKKHVLKSDWAYGNQVVIADLNGDGRSDILAESGSDRRAVPWSDVRWWENRIDVVSAPPSRTK